MILKSVLDDAFSRLTTSKKCEGYFGFYEVLEWPKGLKQGLDALQILTLANPVRSLECPGCEEGCFMPVDILSGENGKTGRAFISCDKTANLGRIPIKLNQLVQWKMTGNSLAMGLRAMFRSNAESDMTMTESGARWAIGWFKGKKKRGQISLTLDKSCKLNVAGHRIDLPDLLKVGISGIELDISNLEWLVDHPIKGESKSVHISSTEKRQNKKAATQARYQDWQRAAKEYSRRHPKASTREIAEHLSKQPISAGKSADTIRKHIS